jgi:hypothetical protein
VCVKPPSPCQRVSMGCAPPEVARNSWRFRARSIPTPPGRSGV